MIDFGSSTKGLDPQEVKDFVNKTTIDYFGGKAKMRKYTGKQSVLDEALGEYKDLGFSLTKLDCLSIELWFKAKRIAVYNWDKVTFDIIREGCANYFKAIAGWAEEGG